ncbi:hypothetical protein GCM10009133_33640 [Cocleimonas flava]|uniref:Uncharacterized protein n=1 Tax=Cocleimonas flava TaxID=634765 RepID=A0A4R1F7W3_9GAMM|nr:hypothetical protein [Cocleimonas flava]TCJ88792.1 hypothetical protein EV695_0651 [Cocleimonas flava]
MKNNNQQYQRKFERQVNHLSGFVGMPIRSGRQPTLSEIRENDRQILEQQAKGVEPRKNSLLQRVFAKLTATTTNASSHTVKAINTISTKSDKAVEKKRKSKELVRNGSVCCH